MPFLKALGLTILSLLFVAAGVYMLMDSDAPDTSALAIGVIAFFGACAIVGALQLVPRQRAVLDADGGLTLMPDRAQVLGLALGGAGMAWGCYVFAPQAASEGKIVIVAVCYFGALFFGLCAAAGLWRFIVVRPVARIDREGVRTFGAMAWEYRWRDVIGLQILSVRSQRFIVFETEASMPTLLGLPSRTLGVSGTRLAFDELYALTERLWLQHGPVASANAPLRAQPGG